MIAKDLRVLVTLFRTEGLREVLRRMAFRFLHVHTFCVFRLHLRDTMPLGQVPSGLEIVEVSRDRLHELREGRSDLTLDFYRDESNSRLRCWVALEGGKLGFVAWVSHDGSSGMVRVGATEAELDYIYCLRQLRGRRVATNAFLLIARTLFEEGVTSLYLVAHSGNPPIIKSVLACGFVRIGSIKRFGFLTWPRTPVEYQENVAAA